jgi:hypothetical protein
VADWGKLAKAVAYVKNKLSNVLGRQVFGIPGADGGPLAPEMVQM